MLVQEADLVGLLQAAGYHRVVGAVYFGLKGCLAPESEPLSALRRAYHQGLAAVVRVEETLVRARDVLEALGVPWLVVKGPALEATAYSQRGLRLYEDLDLVVPSDVFGEALCALEQAGFRVLDRNWELIRSDMLGEIELSLRPGFELDLHWHLVYRRRLRETLNVRMEDFFRRARQVEIGGVPVRTFDDCDTLIHLCLHACQEGGDRLVWLADIERIIAREAPDWDEVVRRALDRKVNLFVGTMLLRSRAVLGAPVPDHVLRRLIPGGLWIHLLSALDRRFPPERATRRTTPAKLVARSTRRDVPATLARVARSVGFGFVRRTGGFMRTGKWVRDEWRVSPESSRSLRYPSGDGSTRAEFLARVATKGDERSARD